MEASGLEQEGGQLTEAASVCGPVLYATLWERLLDIWEAETVLAMLDVRGCAGINLEM